MNNFCFTVDDNIRFLKELTNGDYKSIFEHPYLAMYKRLHNKLGLKVQLNLFYEMPEFNLTQMTTAFNREWRENADWLKLSFHSKLENVKPYENSGYDEVFSDCNTVNDEILRFASQDSLAQTTTIHYCVATAEGMRALKENNVKGLLGLFGDEQHHRTSYNLDEKYSSKIRSGAIVEQDGIAFAPIDIVLNLYSKEEILSKLLALTYRENIWVMIHEQYFYEDYSAFQPDFEEKLTATFELLKKNKYKSCFFEELI